MARETREQWEARVRRWQRSGMDAASFAARAGDAVDILWPPEDPEQQWEVDTIEHVADVFSTLRPESEG